MQWQGNTGQPDAFMWLQAAMLSATALRDMAAEARERASDLDRTAEQVQESVRAALRALRRREER